MSLPRSFVLFLICAAGGLAKDPDWRLATILDSQSLKSPSDPAMQVYSPRGKPIDMLPDVQKIPLQGNQRLLLARDAAYIVDPSAAPENHGVMKGLFERRGHACELPPRDTVMYYEGRAHIEVLDAAANICRLQVVRKVSLSKQP